MSFADQMSGMGMGSEMTVHGLKQRYPARVQSKKDVDGSPNSKAANGSTISTSSSKSSNASAMSTSTALTTTPVPSAPSQMMRSISGRSDVSVRFRDRLKEEERKEQFVFETPPRTRRAKGFGTPLSPKGEEDSLELGMSMTNSHVSPASQAASVGDPSDF